MIYMNFNRVIFSFVFLLAAALVHAQGDDNIKATVDKKKILIGEPMLLTIEAYFHPTSALSFAPIDSIAHFEFLEQPVIDSSNYNDGTFLKGIYKLTSFDSGHWVIPSFILSPTVKTDPIQVDVIFSDFDPNQDFHDIKDILEVAPPKRKQAWWFIVAGVFLLAGLAVYLLRKKKPLSLSVPAVEIDPFEEAMNQLDLLQQNKPEAKKYHSKLTQIFRLYVYRKKGILSLQKTTADLVIQLKDLNFSKEQFDQLSRALDLSDFVKFAKYTPTEDDNKIVFENLRNAIMTIEKTEAGPPAFGGS